MSTLDKANQESRALLDEMSFENLKPLNPQEQRRMGDYQGPGGSGNWGAAGQGDKLVLRR